MKLCLALLNILADGESKVEPLEKKTSPTTTDPKASSDKPPSSPEKDGTPSEVSSDEQKTPTADQTKGRLFKGSKKRKHHNEKGRSRPDQSCGAFLSFCCFLKSVASPLLRFLLPVFTTILLLRCGDVELNPGPNESNSVSGVSDIMLVDIADALGDDMEIVRLGSHLRTSQANIKRYLTTNRMDGILTSKGTYQMLVDWRNRTKMQHQLTELREALVSSNLQNVADQYLPQEMRHESRGTQTSLTLSTSSMDRSESLHAARKISQEMRHKSHGTQASLTMSTSSMDRSESFHSARKISQEMRHESRGTQTSLTLSTSSMDRSESLHAPRKISQGSDDFSRIVPSADECPRCIVRQRDLTLHDDHLSGWWIISYIRRYFICKQLICTFYVPISTFGNDRNYVLLNIKIHGTEEDDIPGYKVAFPGKQYIIRWGQGPLKITYQEGQTEVSTMTLEECAFSDMTSHRILFTLQPREGKLDRILLTFILQQARITKYIKFPMKYEMRHESRTQASLTLSTSSMDRSESLLAAREISQAPLSSPGLAELPGSSQQRHETVDSSSAEPAGTDDGNKVLTSPCSPSPPRVESPHRYQGTRAAEAGVADSTSSAVSDYRCVSVAVRAEGTKGALASPEFAANILKEVASRFPGGQMNQPSGNVFINLEININVNNPQGDSSTTGPVPITSIIPQRLKHELRCRLNRESPIRQDWRGLASELELDEYINSLEQYKNPTEELLVIAESSKKILNLEDLAKAFHRMNRGDCEELCLNYAFEGKRTMSADAHKDPVKDEDTDSSDD